MNFTEFNQDLGHVISQIRLTRREMLHLIDFLKKYKTVICGDYTRFCADLIKQEANGIAGSLEDLHTQLVNYRCEALRKHEIRSIRYDKGGY